MISDGATLAGEEAGEGVGVVLLHGLTATRRYVVMGSRALERSGHRVVAYDARGHGQSFPAASYGYADLAHDLEAVLDDRELDRAVLAGASMGAHTLLRFALDHPDRVAGIVAITPAYDPEHPTGHHDLDRWDELAAGLRAGGIEGFVAAYGDPPDERWRETVFRVIRQRLGAHADLDAVADALEQVPRSRPFEAWADLRALRGIPAVVVASRDEADPGHPLATGERYAAALGGELRTEEPGASPLAWQGGQLSRVIAELAARA